MPKAYCSSLRVLTCITAIHCCLLSVTTQVPDTKSTAVATRRPVVGIHDVHGDEKRYLANLLEELGLEARMLPNGVKFKLRGIYNDTAAYDILLLPMFHHSIQNIEVSGKPILITVVSLLPDRKESLQRPSRLLGYICFSEICQRGCTDFGTPSIHLKRRYDYRSLTPSTLIHPAAPLPQQILTVIAGYRVKSAQPNHLYHGRNPYEVWRNVTRNLPDVKQCPSDLYNGTEIFCNDVHELRRSKALVHIKYWGHVCNAVVKALALGIPVLMDKATYELAGFSGYLVHGLNGWVAADPNDLTPVLQDDNALRLLRHGAYAYASNLQMPIPREELAYVALFLLQRFASLQPLLDYPIEAMVQILTVAATTT